MSKKKFNGKKHSKNSNISPAESGGTAAEIKETQPAEASDNSAYDAKAQPAEPGDNAAEEKEAQALEPEETAEVKACEQSEEESVAQSAEPSGNAADAEPVQPAHGSDNASEEKNSSSEENTDDKSSAKSSSHKDQKKKKHKSAAEKNGSSEKKSKTSSSNRAFAVSLFIIVLIGLAAIFLYNYLQENAPVQIKESPVASATVPAESPSPVAEPLHESSPSASTSPQSSASPVAENKPKEAPSLILNKVSAYLADKGDYIKLGKYPQNSGDTPKSIEWLVLAKDNESQLVISRYALDCKPFNSEFTDISWNDCELRQWLNKDFYNTAFSFSEKNKILTSKINIDIADKSKRECEDKVFCLSVIEAKKLFDSNKQRACEPTKYAVSHNAYKDPDTNYCLYWLRSPGLSANGAAMILSNGQIWSNGYAVHESDLGVRPAMRIRL